MFLGPSLGFLVKALDVLLELLAVHPPYASAADLDRRQLSGAHERIDLGHAHAQIFRHIVQGSCASHVGRVGDRCLDGRE